MAVGTVLTIIGCCIIGGSFIAWGGAAVLEEINNNNPEVIQQGITENKEKLKGVEIVLEKSAQMRKKLVEARDLLDAGNKAFKDGGHVLPGRGFVYGEYLNCKGYVTRSIANIDNMVPLVENEKSVLENEIKELEAKLGNVNNVNQKQKEYRSRGLVSPSPSTDNANKKKRHR